MSVFNQKTLAFTLVEMLAVVGIVSLLAMLLLPAIGRTGARARRIQCVVNLQQTGVGFQSFLHDHGDNFPMGVSTNSGGTQEPLISNYMAGGDFFLSYTHFQALSNDLSSPQIFACPADPVRSPASDFANLNNRAVSYFVVGNADYALPNSILAGDRNITGGPTTAARGYVRVSADSPARWTREMHNTRGNELFADGHVERVNSPGVRLPVRNAPTVMDLMLPAVKPNSLPNSVLASIDAGKWTGTATVESRSEK